jgi:hypothetical protein
MKKIQILCLILLLLPWGATAGVHDLKPGLKLLLPDLPAPWVISAEPIAALVNHMAEHVQEEAAAKGHTLSAEEARAGALKKLKQNELFVLNPQSGAHVLISFEPLGKKEAEPSAKTIAKSAQYAGESAIDEGWTEVAERQAVTVIKGAQQAQWFEIDYTHEGSRQAFIGIVGFANPYWFWVYANDHQQDPADRAVLEKLMREIEIRIEP